MEREASVLLLDQFSYQALVLHAPPFRAQLSPNPMHTGIRHYYTGGHILLPNDFFTLLS